MSESPLKDKLRLETYTNVNLLPILAILVIISIGIAMYQIIKKYFTRQTVNPSSYPVASESASGQSVKSVSEVVTDTDFKITMPEDIPEVTQ